MRVLLVENNVAVAEKLVAFFDPHSIRVEIADTGEEALELLRHYEFDIVVLNLWLPDMDGSRVITRMRTARLSVPVLALSRRAQPRLSVDAFNAGADDVVDQQVDRAELVARMYAIVRRARGHSQSSLCVGRLTLDLDQREVTANGNAVRLTGKEFELLQLLMLRKNMVLTKELMLEQLYGGMDEPEAKVIDVFVCKIRKKLEQAGLKNVVGTVWGRGYTIRDTGWDDQRSALPQAPVPADHARPSLVFA